MDVRPDALVKIIENDAVRVHEHDDAGRERDTPSEKIRGHVVDADTEDTVADRLRDRAMMRLQRFRFHRWIIPNNSFI